MRHLSGWLFLFEISDNKGMYFTLSLSEGNDHLSFLHLIIMIIYRILGQVAFVVFFCFYINTFDFWDMDMFKVLKFIIKTFGINSDSILFHSFNLELL